MKAGNAAVTNISDGISRILMTGIGLMQWWLENMVIDHGELSLVLHRRQSGYGLLASMPTKFIVDWIFRNKRSPNSINFGPIFHPNTIISSYWPSFHLNTTLYDI